MKQRQSLLDDIGRTQTEHYAACRRLEVFDSAHAYAKLAEPITLLTQEQDTLTCEDYDPDEPLDLTITPLGLIGMAERAGIPATWDDGDGATSITAR